MSMPYCSYRSHDRHSRGSRVGWAAMWGIRVCCGVVAAFAIVAFTAPSAAARPLCPVCMAPDKVTVSGPGLAGTVAVTDTSALSSMGIDTFFDPNAHAKSIAAPAQADAGYEVTRFYNLGSGGTDSWASYWTQGFDHFRYVPGTATQVGALYYEGSAPGDTDHMVSAIGLSAYVGKWFQATPQEDAAMRQLLASASGLPATSVTPVAQQPASASVPVSPAQTGAQSQPVTIERLLPLLAAISAALLLGVLAFGASVLRLRLRMQRR